MPGSTPHSATLLIIDMINDLDFEGGEECDQSAGAAAATGGAA
ncbi:hypothetical protein [Sphingomonas sp.]